MLVRILLYVALGLFLFTALRFALFLLSNGLAGSLAVVRRGTGNLWFALARGIGTAMAADLIALPSCLALALPERRGGKGVPVLLVHGLYHNRTAWLVFGRRLRRAGFANLHTYGYNTFTKDFGAALEGMRAKLDELLGDDPEARVLLVGHSLGGLVCRCAAGDPRYRDRVAGLVTLGSPHGGSQLAWLGGNRMARDLIPGRAISRAVAQAPDPDCPRLGIYTLTDDYVFPLSLLRTGRDGWTERVCAPMGHVWMLYSGEVAALACDFLADAADQ